MYDMQTAIEISETHLRWCRFDQGRLVGMDSVKLPVPSDPAATLAAAPLPTPLGPVKLICQHPDILIRYLVLAPAPPDRLGRIIRFELQTLAGDDGGNKLLHCWHVPALGGASGDMRVMAMVAKRELVTALRDAIARHNGRLQSLVVPPVGLYHAWRRLHPDDEANLVLLELADDATHCALIKGGELIFVRSGAPGFNQLVADVAELRGIEQEDAAIMAAKIGAKAPDDLHDVVRRHATAVASAVANHLRFAKAQLRLDSFEPHTIQLAGAGAQLPGLSEILSERLHAPCQTINPFSGILAALPTAVLDDHAALPSPWTTGIGVAACDQVCLDGMAQIHEERRLFWSTSGALRIAAAACAALIVAAALMQFWRGQVQAGAEEILIQPHQYQGEEVPGLVPKAREAADLLETDRKAMQHIQTKLQFLDSQRLPARIGVEILNVISTLQDPRRTPIFLTGYHVGRQGHGSVQIELTGYAQDAVRAKAGDVLDRFYGELQEAYPLIASITMKEVALSTSGRQSFNWVIVIPDRDPATG